MSGAAPGEADPGSEGPWGADGREKTAGEGGALGEQARECPWTPRWLFCEQTQCLPAQHRGSPQRPAMQRWAQVEEGQLWVQVLVNRFSALIQGRQGTPASPLLHEVTVSRPP